MVWRNHLICPREHVHELNEKISVTPNEVKILNKDPMAMAAMIDRVEFIMLSRLKEHVRGGLWHRPDGGIDFTSEAAILNVDFISDPKCVNPIHIIEFLIKLRATSI